MQIYIAYKYTHIKNKSELKVNLEHLADLLEKKGHNTFLLNRDAKAWGKKHVSTFNNVSTIIKNIFKSQCIVAYVNSSVISPGIIFEFIVSKILQKRIVMCVDFQIENKVTFLKKFPTEIVIYNGIKDLENKIDKIF